MKKDDYSIACTEVLEVLNYISKDDYNKIPKNIIAALEKNKRDDIIFLYNPWKSLNEQAMSKEGRIMLASFYRDYWATDEEKQKINAKQNTIIQKIEEEKEQKYSYNNLFKNKNEKTEIQDNVDKTDIAPYKKNTFTNFINKIKKFFGRK
ncbi:MAG: hypothetical protein IJH12_04630 [Clostridia bacterium]|nr:hypothetical protein [Clostridia bacterium]